MALFQYEAMTAAGKSTKGEIEASSREQAIENLRKRGLYPTSVKEKTSPKSPTIVGTKRKKTFTIGGVNQKQLTEFTRQLATLQDAGLPIVRSLRILETQMKPGVLKNALIDIADDVEQGSSLSDAMAKHPKVFDKLYVNMIRAGEAGGVLNVILQRLADFREKSAKLRKQIISALVYPTAVISIAGLILTGIMIFIVPKFQEIFSDMQIELPGITQSLLEAANIIKTYWYLLPGIPFGLFILYKLIRLSRTGRYIIDYIKFYVPVFGKITSKTVISRFCRTLGTLLASGVPILEALNIVRGTAGNEVLATAIGKVHNAVREGENMAGPLRQTKIFDELVINMIDVGEETGKVESMLVKIADTYDNDVEALVAGLMSLLEPFMIIGMGLIIGTIVIALFMPLIKLMGSM